MSVIINDFEVMPSVPEKDNQTAGKKANEKGKNEQIMTDQELKKILTRHVERLERVSAP